MKIKTKVLSIIAVLAVVVAIAIPFESTVVPEIQIKAVDEEGNPARGIIVKQEWRDWAVESDQHSEYSETDEDGNFKFPRRISRASFFKRMLGAFSAFWDQGMHASIGPKAILWIHGEDPYYWGSFSYIAGKSIPKKMVLKKWDTPIFP